MQRSSYKELLIYRACGLRPVLIITLIYSTSYATDEDTIAGVCKDKGCSKQREQTAHPKLQKDKKYVQPSGMEWRSHGRDNDDLVSQLSRSGILKTQRVVKAMRKMDRGNYCTYSPYMDSPQSIGYGVTISAPHMHAHALEIDEFMLLIASWLIRATWREIQKGLYGNSKQNILYMTLLYRLSPS